MDFKAKYTSSFLQEKDKIALTNDAYAIGEMLDELIKKLEMARITR